MAAAAFIIIIGSTIERLALVSLAFLALLAGGQLAASGLRSTCFLALLMALGRYGSINPYIHLVAQVVMMLLSTVMGVQSLASFAFAPCILLLLIASRIQTNGNQKALMKVAAYSVISLGFAMLGFGSRAALFVWFVAVWRRSVKFIAGLVLVLIPLTSLLPDIPVVKKLFNSVSEISAPVEDNGTINLRGIESFVFFNYISNASLRELALGSTRLIYIPGELIGNPDDPIYLPHNQLMGLFFQFGLAGILVFSTYLWHLARYYSFNRDCRFFMLCLLPPFMLFKHGFLDSDFVLILASLNWVALRDGRR